MKILTGLAFPVLMLVATTLHAEDYPWLPLKATADGLGDVRIGMTVEQASANFPVSFLNATWFYGSNSCASYAFGEDSRAERWHVRFIAEDKIIRRIDIYTPAIANPFGLRVGDRLESLALQEDAFYKITQGHDPSVRYVTTDAVQYIGDQESSEQFDNPEDINTPLFGRIAGWSLGDFDAGTVEGCL